MERFICDRIRTDRTRIVLADGRPPDGPGWVDLTLLLCDDGDTRIRAWGSAEPAATNRALGTSGDTHSRAQGWAGVAAERWPSGRTRWPSLNRMPVGNFMRWGQELRER